MKRSLRIFYAVDSTPNAIALQNSRLWYYNLFLPLVDLGYDVIPFDYDLGPHFQHADPHQQKNRSFIEKKRPKLGEALLEQIRAAHRLKPIDLFFSYFYSAFVRPEVIREIRSMGIVTVNWYCNASYQFHLVAEIAPAYDYCLVPEKFRLEDYHHIGANPIYCQEAANPNIYKPYPLPREYDVTFVGQKYGDRPAHIRYLLDNGIDVRVWGPGWQTTLLPSPQKLAGKLRRLRSLDNSREAARLLVKHLVSRWSGQTSPLIRLPPQICGGVLSDDELIKMYSRSKISLGFSTVGPTGLSNTPIKQVRLRDFEAPMSGAFYMVEYMEELEEFFEIGKEIVCYHDEVDLVDKIKYYLAHGEERDGIRHAGYQRAVRDHSWHKRFETVFRKMGLDL